MNKSQRSARRRMARVFSAVSAVAAVAAVGVTAAPAYAASVPMTLSMTSGPNGGGNSVTATATPTTAVPTPFPESEDPLVVQFQFYSAAAPANASCGATYRTPAAIAATAGVNTAGIKDSPSVKRVSATKIAFAVPEDLLLQTGQTTSRWNVCVYDQADTTEGELLATGTYSLAVRPVITSVNPISSPALGGQTITVLGEGFSTVANATTATVGGSALTNIKVASNGRSFTATTPPRSAEDELAVVVSTVGGVVNSLDPDNNGVVADDGDPATPDESIYFEYTNGVTITPNTSPADKTVDIDVRGVGFQQLRFDADGAAVDDTAHVFLVQGTYTKATNRGVQECGDVLVIDDTELICSVDLSADRLDPTDHSQTVSGGVLEGTYTVTVVNNGDPAVADADLKQTIVSSGATFTVAPY
ncbi:IPT/TIG domain-containing protein [Actinoplanes sp. NBC_00393]|uniref:IPT/TIG domain-containing protein n=1 Tax=Actinoplanes sp. NBC_00393 TaxID=2975953 RepID=UPI002E24E49D